jgi:hypothetical protein
MLDGGALRRPGSREFAPPSIVRFFATRVWVAHASRVLVSASRRDSLLGKPVIARRDHQHAGRARYPAVCAPGTNCHCAARAFGNTLEHASLHHC